ncbi:hypothetical protein A2U01_0102746, partial [Trifolium medium]|nr:hypothetical protein [Trifolium medium]
VGVHPKFLLEIGEDASVQPLESSR